NHGSTAFAPLAESSSSRGSTSSSSGTCGPSSPSGRQDEAPLTLQPRRLARHRQCRGAAVVASARMGRSLVAAVCGVLVACGAPSSGTGGGGGGASSSGGGTTGGTGGGSASAGGGTSSSG